MRKKMSEQEKRELKARKRRLKLQELINSQYSIISFHRIFEYLEDTDHSIRSAEVKAAKEKISLLEKQL